MFDVLYIISAFVLSTIGTVAGMYVLVFTVSRAWADGKYSSFTRFSHKAHPRAKGDTHG